jgi:TonB family protein
MLPLLSASRPAFISHPESGVPEKARADHVEGCAAIAFRVAPDGTPKNFSLAAESPGGYGFADLLMRDISASRFQPPPEEQIDWYYEVRHYHP